MDTENEPIRQLHLAALDHRASLDKALAGLNPVPGRGLDRMSTKQMIWRGIQRSFPATDFAAVLTDADAGSVLDAAKDAGAITAMALERSGQRWLEAERSDDETAQLLAKHAPDFAKLLVRWHPADPLDKQRRQIATMLRLKRLAEEAGAALMLELLIVAAGDDATLNHSNPDAFHDEVLPVRLADSIRQLSDADVVPSMWKIDGLPRANACEHVAAAVRAGSDGHAGIVVLGAGKDLKTVGHWFEATAGHDEFRGFAIGRTIWWDAVKGFVSGCTTSEETERLIGDRFAEVVAVYRRATDRSER